MRLDVEVINVDILTMSEGSSPFPAVATYVNLATNCGSWLLIGQPPPHENALGEKGKVLLNGCAFRI